jgi:hypothetical protein
MLFIFILSSLALADDPDPEPKIVYKEKTEIDFEALDIEGELIKPQGALLLERSKAAFNPLIRLRKDFNVEMSDSVKSIQ